MKNRDQEMIDILFQRKLINQEDIGSILIRSMTNRDLEMFSKMFPKLTNSYVLSGVIKYAAIDRPEFFNQILSRLNDIPSLVIAYSQASSEEMVNLVRERAINLVKEGVANLPQEAQKAIFDDPVFSYVYKTLGNTLGGINSWMKSHDPVYSYLYNTLGDVNSWMKSHDPLKIPGQAEASSIPRFTQPPLVALNTTETILNNSSGALPSSNPTDKPAPAQAAGPSWQNIGAQVALAAVAGALVYGAGKAAYDLYKRNTGPDATPEDINKATALLKKVAKFDPKELSKISQEFKTHADQITDRLNDLYDARKSNSEEYKDLREQLDKVTANQDAISTLQNSMKAMKLEAKHFVAPKYALKEGYVGGIIKECANIQDICEKLGVSMAKSPKSHAQKVMAEREGKSAGDKAL